MRNQILKIKCHLFYFPTVALYVLPRAGDSLWYILVNRHLLPDIKNAEVLLKLLPYFSEGIFNCFNPNLVVQNTIEDKIQDSGPLLG